MKKIHKIILLFVCIALGVVLGLFVFKKTNISQFAKDIKDDSLSKDIVISVGDVEVSETEARVYLAAMNSKIENIYGENIWDYKIDKEGTTYKALMKKNVLDKIIYIKLVSSNAESYGVKLESDDMLDVEEYTTSFFENVTEETAGEYKLSKDLVKGIYKDLILAEKVYEKITLNAEVEADENSCRQADFYRIIINKYYTDENGSPVYYKEDELADIKTRAESAYKSAGSDFLQAAPVYSDAPEMEITVGLKGLPVELAEDVMALSSGSMSPLLETENAYYIYYCVNQNNESATLKAIDDEILSQRDSYFNTVYAKWRENTEIIVNEERWSNL